MTFSFANYNKRTSRFTGLTNSSSATEVITWFQFNGASLDHPLAPDSMKEKTVPTSRQERQFAALLTHSLG